MWKFFESSLKKRLADLTEVSTTEERVHKSRFPHANTSNRNRSKTSMKARLSSLRHVQGSSLHIIRFHIPKAPSGHLQPSADPSQMWRDHHAYIDHWLDAARKVKPARLPLPVRRFWSKQARVMSMPA